MQIQKGVIPLFSLAALILTMAFSYQQISSSGPIDAKATKATRALYQNLKDISGKKILFGHQDDLAYGVLWKDWHKKKSDIHDVCGKYPALVGWEMSKLGKSEYNIDTVNFEHMKGWMKEVYKMGSINSISWHMDNFLDGKSSWDPGTENVVAAILPGGANHADYTAKLDLFADYVNDLRVGFIFKKSIPIIFRPFHEHTGGWFWWGQPHCTPAEYKALWQFTVTYLRDTKGLHNILYCYSPDVFRDREHYLECYPGDEWVDLLGVDDYHDVGPNGKVEDLIRRLQTVVQLAKEKDKVAVFSETGRDGIPEPDWWTERLLNPIKNDPIASQISFLMVWRNARPSHHYGPYPGHSSVPDFIKFANDPKMVFQDQLPSMYKLKK